MGFGLLFVLNPLFLLKNIQCDDTTHTIGLHFSLNTTVHGLDAINVKFLSDFFLYLLCFFFQRKWKISTTLIVASEKKYIIESIWNDASKINWRTLNERRFDDHTPKKNPVVHFISCITFLQFHSKHNQ